MTTAAQRMALRRPVRDRVMLLLTMAGRQLLRGLIAYGAVFNASPVVMMSEWLKRDGRRSTAKPSTAAGPRAPRSPVPPWHPEHLGRRTPPSPGELELWADLLDAS